MKPKFIKTPQFKDEPLFTLENTMGLLIAILIIFDLKVETRISNLLNTPLGMISSMLIIILLFIFMNPVIGILFIIYLYETIKESSNYSYTTQAKDNKLKQLNPIPQMEVEEEIIQKIQPIINLGNNNNVTFQPYMDQKLNMTLL